ncbi:MAG: cell wall hydrolase [Paracoccus sp. (in: a-proteobacteria)]|uniref:cell wall hydrolase n=1 Tax=Paracoccus sp. TaxID=267 RepID=UPI00391A7652
MQKLLQRLVRACLCAATAIPLSTTIAAAGGSGSLFSSDTGLFAAAAMPAAAAIQLESARRSPLLYANSDAVKIEISADMDIEDLHLASVNRVSQADLDCMAEALYHEARGEGVQGQQAVAEVILNRVDSRVFPGSVCGVINQPSQFSYTIGGAKPIRNKSAYLRARDIAQSALAGAPRTLTGGATYFHTPAVRPAWSSRFQRTTRIGRHIFYRDNRRLASN